MSRRTKATSNMSASSNGLLTGPSVCGRYGVSSMTLYRWQRDPTLGFPNPIEINGRRYWYEQHLQKWERERVVRR